MSYKKEEDNFSRNYHEPLSEEEKMRSYSPKRNNFRSVDNDDYRYENEDEFNNRS